MPTLSYNILSNLKTTLSQDIEALAQAGIPAVGLHSRKVDEDNVAPLRNMLREAGLTVSCFSSAGRFLVPGGRERHIEETKRRIEVCAELEAGCLLLLTGGPRTSLDWREAERDFLSALEQVLPMAEEYSVRLGLEPVTHVAQHISYLHLLGEAVDLVEKVDSPYLGLVADIWYLGWQRDFLDQVKRAGEKLWIFQVADQTADAISMQGRTLLGQGIIPLNELLPAIADTGFDGVYDAEIFNDTFTEQQLAALIPSTKAFFDRLWSPQAMGR